MKKSYICSYIKSFAQIEESIPLDIEELTIINSFIYSEKEFDGEKYNHLNTIIIVQRLVFVLLIYIIKL